MTLDKTKKSFNLVQKQTIAVMKEKILEAWRDTRQTNTQDVALKRL